MSAYMRRDIWQLHPVDVIVSADHMIETMLPVHCHKWHSIIIVKQESAISVYGFLHFRYISVLDDCLKHLCHILCDWQYSCSGICLCGFYDVSHIRCSLQLVVNIHSSVLKINVPQRQSTKSRYSHSRMKEYVHHFTVFAVHHIVMHKLQKLSHLVFYNCLSCDCIIYQYSGKLKSEWILYQNVINHRLWNIRLCGILLS